MKLTKKQTEFLTNIFRTYYEQKYDATQSIALTGDENHVMAKSLISKGLLVLESSDTDLIVVRIAENLPQPIEELKIFTALSKA